MRRATPLDIQCGPIKTICHRGNTSTSQTDHVSLGMHVCPLYSWVVTTTNLCGAATTIKTAVDF
uniref:Uncharacterized protein n=1 Tax=Aegilops tauschii subsp. strangulata TaxID=200361 RepID=A0A453AY72_AEGTS